MFDDDFSYQAEPTDGAFWMVYGWGQGAPNYRHASESAAQAEAARLARMAPGTRFYVLRATEWAQRRPDVETGRIEEVDLVAYQNAHHRTRSF